MIQSKRPLPPTPTTDARYKNINDTLDRERKYYSDFCTCSKTIKQKDSVISNLKTIAAEWKRKALEYEIAYKESKRLGEEREKFLTRQHEAEIEAIIKIQTEQLDDNHELILQLEEENIFLRSQLGQSNSTDQVSIETHQQQQQQQLPNSDNLRNGSF